MEMEDSCWEIRLRCGTFHSSVIFSEKITVDIEVSCGNSSLFPCPSDDTVYDGC